MPNLPAKDRFQKLVNDIALLYTNARQAQVQFAWETGRRIVEEEQDGQMRAAYGSALIPKLSEVLSEKFGPGFSERTLQKMRHFYTHHSIPPTSAKLGWSDYVELMPVKDGKMRKRLEHRILKEGLKSYEIRQEVRRLRLEKQEEPEASSSTPVSPKIVTPLKYPTGLKLNTFLLSSLKVKLKDGDFLIDCGFFVSWPVTKAALKTINVTDGMSYTYAATVDRVVDGDTLLVLIEVGFGIIVHDRLRLRGINCPEVSTPEGIKAKRFVEKLLPAGSTIVLQSHKCRTDIYGRFVADVLFIRTPGRQGAKATVFENAAAIIKDGTYLNQLLLDEGLAVIYRS